MLELIPVPEAFAEHVRASRVDPHRQELLAPVTVDKAGAYPCRICLRDAEPGEQVLLVSYLPFKGNGPFRSVNAIYLHAQRCPAAAARSTLIPEQLRRRLLSVRVYDAAEMLLDADVVEGKELASCAERLLSVPGASFINVFIARPGCFAVRMERGA